jgi:hypothetical protein
LAGFLNLKDAAKRPGNGSLGVFIRRRSKSPRHLPAPFGLVWLLLMISLSMLPNYNARGAANGEADLLAKDLEIPLWDKSFNLRSGVGYKDNVLLNDNDSRGSGFFVNGADITIFRLPLDDWEFHFLLTGDDIRYWRNVGVDHEDLWSAAAEVKKSFGDTWQASLESQYIYLSQVLEITEIAFNTHLPPTNVVGHTIVIRPGVQKWLASNLWVRLEADGLRQFFTEPADSYFRFGPRVVLGYDYGRNSEATLSCALLEQENDHFTKAMPDGTPIPNTSSRALRYETALASKHNWDVHKHWQTTTKLSFLYFQDNFSSYYNYYEYGASELLRFSAGTWNITGTASVLHDEYPIQTVSGDGTPRFRTTTMTLGLKVEKNLIKSLKIFVNYENASALSDSQDEVYHANTISGGLDWEF